MVSSSHRREKGIMSPAQAPDAVAKVAIFGKEGCPKCQSTKRKLQHFLGRWELDHRIEIVFHDLETLDGRAEGAFYDVEAIPATIIERQGRQLARWDGDVPGSRGLKQALEEGVNASAH